MSDEPTFDVEVEGTTYTLVPQPLRTSLSDSPAALWGFQVHVLREGELAGIKTCFVGRVRVHTKDPTAADGPVAAPCRSFTTSPWARFASASSRAKRETRSSSPDLERSARLM